MVIGSVVYLTSIDRSRDFAVLKATGATNQSLLAGLAFQAWTAVRGRRARWASLLSFGLAGAFPMRTEVATDSYVTLVSVAVGVALVAAGVQRPSHAADRPGPGVRRSVTVLHIEDLTVEYQSGDYLVRPLDRFNLQASAGELVLLLGASGCGKTTLLSAHGRDPHAAVRPDRRGRHRHHAPRRARPRAVPPHRRSGSSSRRST